MDLTSTFSSLGIALGLGLLVGMQREQVATQLAGLRTFALITVLGTICGLLAVNFGGWVIAAGFLALTGALMTGHVAELKGEKFESGVTTEVAALAMFGVGALRGYGIPRSRHRYRRWNCRLAAFQGATSWARRASG